MKKTELSVLSIFVAMLVACAPASTGWKPAEQQKREAQSQRRQLTHEVTQSIEDFKAQDSSMKIFFDEAYGYAIFPTVAKGAIGLGAAYGKGQVFEQGFLIGNASLTQISIGLQLGGQAYREIIFFKNKAILADFTAGKFKFDAQASAVAATTGAAANVAYSGDVAVFSLIKGGLMFEASLGGQKFGFQRTR